MDVGDDCSMYCNHVISSVFQNAATSCYHTLHDYNSLQLLFCCSQSYKTQPTSAIAIQLIVPQGRGVSAQQPSNSRNLRAALPIDFKYMRWRYRVLILLNNRLCVYDYVVHDFRPDKSNLTQTVNNFHELLHNPAPSTSPRLHSPTQLRPREPSKPCCLFAVAHISARPTPSQQKRTPQRRQLRPLAVMHQAQFSSRSGLGRSTGAPGRPQR